MTRIAITGANGTVGTALKAELSHKHDIIAIDLPQIDIFDEKKLRQALKPAEVIIHLAGVFGKKADGKENWLSPHKDPLNADLFHAVLGMALELTESVDGHAKQFIHASSVHVEDTLGHLAGSKEKLSAVPKVFATEPSSGYGQHKREQEAMLQGAAPHFLHGAVSIRLGGVTPDNKPLREHRRPEVLDHEQRVWLEHGDLASLVEAAIEHPHYRRYDVLYATSVNDGRFHDTTNDFGWTPRANSADHL